MALVVVEGALCPRHHGLVGAHEGHAPVVHQLTLVQVAPELQLGLHRGHTLWVKLLSQASELFGVSKSMDSALVNSHTGYVDKIRRSYSNSIFPVISLWNYNVFVFI